MLCWWARALLLQEVTLAHACDMRVHAHLQEGCNLLYLLFVEAGAALAAGGCKSLKLASCALQLRF